MATRAIVTSHPVVACDVCGRRLLRGENPDLFLAGGQRRTVCELCVPRASAGGWLREADNHALSIGPTRARRAGSLLGRLRQLREPGERPRRREAPSATDTVSGAEQELSDDGLYDFLERGSIGRSDAYEQDLYAGSAAEEAADGRWSAGHDQSDGPRRESSPGGEPALTTSGDLKMARALEVFNAGEQPRRIAGVARSLGSPAVSVRALEESGSTVAIVVAWELCWYRYAIDLGDEAAGVQLVGQGMELEELADGDRLANAGADERGELALLAVSSGH
jgi:hypothetical protein